ncbi:predicted protein [Nematostella vectensis]|uniref:Uncharacterized protein n=1 Tax=Nematostella vectensis TaxID=45351 RepID=A7S3R8_NEMVE|nr:predicted protein [Nematostella vectensis]|eukprot:XP_001633716.1 predicted protein [Nematostella vectensis]
MTILARRAVMITWYRRGSRRAMQRSIVSRHREPKLAVILIPPNISMTMSYYWKGLEIRKDYAQGNKKALLSVGELSRYQQVFKHRFSFPNLFAKKQWGSVDPTLDEIKRKSCDSDHLLKITTWKNQEEVYFVFSLTEAQ